MIDSLRRRQWRIHIFAASYLHTVRITGSIPVAPTIDLRPNTAGSGQAHGSRDILNMRAQSVWMARIPFRARSPANFRSKPTANQIWFAVVQAFELFTWRNPRAAKELEVRTVGEQREVLVTQVGGDREKRHRTKR